jgi:hypothetical protein
MKCEDKGIKREAEKEENNPKRKRCRRKRQKKKEKKKVLVVSLQYAEFQLNDYIRADLE